MLNCGVKFIINNELFRIWITSGMETIHRFMYMFMYVHNTIIHLLFHTLELFWVAPEHLRTDPDRDVSLPGDIYSFGIVLFEILTRSEPYDDYADIMTTEGSNIVLYCMSLHV